MVKQKGTLNLSEETKTENKSNCGQRQGSATFVYHGMTVRTRLKGFLRVTRLIDKLLMTIT